MRPPVDTTNSQPTTAPTPSTSSGSPSAPPVGSLRGRQTVMVILKSVLQNQEPFVAINLKALREEKQRLDALPKPLRHSPFENKVNALMKTIIAVAAAGAVTLLLVILAPEKVLRASNKLIIKNASIEIAKFGLTPTFLISLFAKAIAGRICETRYKQYEANVKESERLGKIVKLCEVRSRAFQNFLSALVNPSTATYTPVGNLSPVANHTYSTEGFLGRYQTAVVGFGCTGLNEN